MAYPLAMRSVSMVILNDYYACLFGINTADLWQGVTARTHGTQLKDFDGYYVASRGSGVHVSMPASAGQEVLRALTGQSASAVQSMGCWDEFAATRSLRVIGPSTHAYLDADPGTVDDVVSVTEQDLASLRGLVDEADWAESGWNDQPAHTFGLYQDGVLIAASNLNSFHHQPRDVGVLVAPGWRGRGLSENLGRHAASFAIRHHGFARWGARNTNAASLAASQRVGFEPWCCQWAVR